MGDIENNSATPILSSKSLSRNVSSESGIIYFENSENFYRVILQALILLFMGICTGYCPSPDHHGSLHSPSADFIRSVLFDLFSLVSKRKTRGICCFGCILCSDAIMRAM